MDIFSQAFKAFVAAAFLLAAALLVGSLGRQGLTPYNCWSRSWIRSQLTHAIQGEK